jgi:hypothetical protein
MLGAVSNIEAPPSILDRVMVVMAESYIHGVGRPLIARLQIA